MTIARGRTQVASLATAILVGLGGLVLALPTLASGPTPDVSAIDARVRAFMESSGVPGAAYGLVQDGTIVHLAAQGVAGPDGRAMSPQTPLVIGSVGKSITALAIRQLVEAGRIDPSAPVTRYLPLFALAGPDGAAADVTIRSLVSHTSGLSTADGQDPRWYEPGLTPEEVVRGIASVRADRPAGTFEYSNLNFVVLGVVIETVTHQAYGDYLRDRVFRPLAMTHSQASPDLGSIVGLGQGHRFLFGQAVPFDEPFPSGMIAAGYQVSTAEDLAHFVGALANGGVYDGVDVVAPGRDPSTDRAYGTDWRDLVAVGAGTSIGQSGSTLATNADILESPSDRLGVVVLLDANPTQLAPAAGAADLALDLLRLSSGGPVLAGAPSVRSVYLVVDAALLLLVALFVVHLARVRTWPARLGQASHRRRFLTRSVVADGVLPLAVLIGVPLLIGSTGSSQAGDVASGWAFAIWTLPDLAWTGLLLAFGGLAVGCYKLLAMRQTDRPAATLPLQFVRHWPGPPGSGRYG